MQLKIQPNYHLKNNTYRNSNINMQNYTLSKDSVSFGTKSKSFAEKMHDEKQKGNWWHRNISWYFGGKRKADEKVCNDIQQELYEQERDIARKVLEEKFRKHKMDEAEEELPNRINKTDNNVSKVDYSCRHNFSKGFSKIAGYAEEKQVLVEHVGIPINLERAGHQSVVPNEVLMFGPLGTGKTSLANAFAEQLDCRLVKFQQSLDDATDMGNLLKEAKKAQKLFEKDKKRTIIQMDCCDVMWKKGSRIVEPFKNFMDNLSKKYHCTIFATANSIEKMDDILLKNGRFDIKIGLSPANKENTKDILEYYAQPFADKGVNYDELAEHIVKSQPDAAFSNYRIRRVVEDLVLNNTGIKKVTQTDLLKSIKEVGPDITKQMLELFKRQIEFIKYF